MCYTLSKPALEVPVVCLNEAEVVHGRRRGTCHRGRIRNRCHTCLLEPKPVLSPPSFVIAAGAEATHTAAIFIEMSSSEVPKLNNTNFKGMDFVGRGVDDEEGD